MREFRSQVAALSGLHELSGEARVVAFRQGMASLGQVAVDPAAVPFEGSDPHALRESVEAALREGLFDALDFLAPSAAGCALYALASALPSQAPERRELGRRVLHALAHGDLDGFTSLATTLALGASRSLDSPLVRARLELSMLVPSGSSLRADALAFALLSRREPCARFVVQPATRDLPARRLAARLLERAARYAVLRAQQGDDAELAIFATPAVAAVFAQLLGDREPLVFRHVASARGLLSAQLAHEAEAIERDLSGSASRARRAATALAARIAVRPEQALARAKALLAGPVLARDQGIAAALIHGLGRALESEPEAAEALLFAALERGGLLAAEALVELWRDLARGEFDERLALAVRMQLHAAAEKLAGDDGQLELVAMLHEELDPGAARVPGVAQLVRDALRVHAQEGPLSARAPAELALATAQRKVARLAQLATCEEGAHTVAVRAELFRLVQELDRGLLESSALRALLVATQERGASAPVTALLSELAQVLVQLEAQPHAGAGPVVHLTLRMRCLRALLHALDAGLEVDDEQLAVRGAQLAAARALCERVARDQASAMDRIVHAALARGVDALLRDEQLELGDVLLCLASTVPLAEGLVAIAEGSLLPELPRALRALAVLMQDVAPTGEEGPEPARCVQGLSELAHALPSDDSPRTEALRRALLALVRGSQAVLGARSIRGLTGSRRALSLLESGLFELAPLAAGARRRLGLSLPEPPLDARSVVAVTRALESGAAHGVLDELAPSLDWLARELERTLPAPLARALGVVLASLRDKPLDGPAASGAQRLAPAGAETCPLPAWVPPSRRLGGFFVVRALGTGLASSVFLVKRSEQRADPSARELALKVARYDGSRARTLSQAEYEAAFARELPALLSVPPHENLAAFVAVEPSAQPKPFLVMEWIDGPTLARVRKRRLAAIDVIDGILAGLEVLHARGIGHLDLAPRNVALRLREGVLRPVLVDFGCAGRHVRPGVGQAAYAAPELWSELPSTPMAVDVYAVGCLAYELVTGRPLFEGAREHVLAAAHMHHDGAPAGVVELAREPRAAGLAAWLKLALRADPRSRASAVELRAALRREVVRAS